MNLKAIFGFVFGVVVGVILTTTVVVNAGNLLSPDGRPGETESYTLADIYHSLNSGQAATQSSFSEPVDGLDNPTMFSLDDIYALTRVRAPVGKTGITTKVYDGDDGDLQAGVAWPVPRFTDNGDGTVTDNLTGLIWLKNANCVTAPDLGSGFSNVNLLSDGECGLDDGSIAGDWRLPNVRELYSLVSLAHQNPALSNTTGDGKWVAGEPFTNVSNSEYWTSSFFDTHIRNYWVLNFNYGLVYLVTDQISRGAWPVRGGQ